MLLHSFAHALMRQIALECGYTAANQPGETLRQCGGWLLHRARILESALASGKHTVSSAIRCALGTWLRAVTTALACYCVAKLSEDVVSEMPSANPFGDFVTHHVDNRNASLGALHHNFRRQRI